MPRETLRANDVRVETFFDVAAYPPRRRLSRRRHRLFLQSSRGACTAAAVLHRLVRGVAGDGGRRRRHRQLQPPPFPRRQARNDLRRRRQPAYSLSDRQPGPSPMRRRRRRSAFARIATKASSPASPRWASRSVADARSAAASASTTAGACDSRFRQQPGHVRVHAATSPRTAPARDHRCIDPEGDRKTSSRARSAASRARTGGRRLGLAGGLFANVRLNRLLAETLRSTRSSCSRRWAMTVCRSARPCAFCSIATDSALGSTIASGLRTSIWPGLRPAHSTPVSRPRPAFEPWRAIRSRQRPRSSEPRPGGRDLCGTHGVRSPSLGARRSSLLPPRRRINDNLNQRLDRSEFMPFAPYVLEETPSGCSRSTTSIATRARFMTITCASGPNGERGFPPWCMWTVRRGRKSSRRGDQSLLPRC